MLFIPAENDTHALETDLRKAIQLINKEVHNIEQKIAFVISDWDGKEYVVLMNTSAAAMSK